MPSTLRTYSYKGVKGVPRPASTYRASRRNAMRGSVWRGVTPTSQQSVVKNDGLIAFWRQSQKYIRDFMRGGNHPRQS